MENRTRTNMSHRKTVSTSKRVNNTVRNTNNKGNVKSKKKKIKPIVIIDYIFLISLALTIIFGIQTNGAFFTPFVIVLIITIVCMSIILINAINSKIKKIMNKRKKEK